MIRTWLTIALPGFRRLYFIRRNLEINRFGLPGCPGFSSFKCLRFLSETSVSVRDDPFSSLGFEKLRGEDRREPITHRRATILGCERV